MAINVDINHPSFLKLLDKVNTRVLSTVKVEKYFTLTDGKRKGISYLTLKLVNNALTTKMKLTENELLSLVTILWKRNEEIENYELAAIFKDIMENFKLIYNSVKPVKKVRQIKVR
jgi:hypothetical protein